MLDKLVHAIEDSGLKDKLSSVFLSNAEGYSRSGYTNISCPGPYEHPTLTCMRDYSKLEHNAYMLYLHTKGVTWLDKPQADSILAWLDYALYFLCYRHQECLWLMDKGMDTVGIDYIPKCTRVWWVGTVDNIVQVNLPRHFSGNLWWAKASYLSGLPEVTKAPDGIFNGERGKAEFWLHMNDPKFFSLFNWDKSHYQEMIKEEEYINEPRLIYD